MKITQQLFTLFVTQQSLSASAFAPSSKNNFVFFRNTAALHYTIDESEQIQQHELTYPTATADIDDMYNSIMEQFTAPTMNLQDNILDQLTDPSTDIDTLTKKITMSPKMKHTEHAQKPAVPIASIAPKLAKKMVGGGGLAVKKFDLAAAKKARTSLEVGAIEGAFQSLAGNQPITLKKIQGGNALKMWNVQSKDIDRVSVRIQNKGVPLSAQVEVWKGSESTPMRLQVACGPVEFPMNACVVADDNSVMGSGAVVQALDQLGDPFSVHGDDNQVSFPFANTVESVQLLLQTDGRPLNARVELIQGPDADIKQVIDINSENGKTQPFFAVIDTPSYKWNESTTIRITNTAASLVFLLTAIVEPYVINNDYVTPVQQRPGSNIDTTDDMFVLG
eukprot:CAMPEP_0170763926 /NCGR_PEP_ID=MMETSP0733-20121128/3684_1 /TAXON_ID=186038 /ORGANISM="Fragilariopsis kerguelensis, Strain L26-C5" /LENGTH=391 /DNA_ID=CAMNT_0011104447 /DNA_START=48 /DNA_END=1223 /DNA_ORIENTATION=-